MGKFLKGIQLVLLVFLSNALFGTHLVGGYISYEYVGESSSGVRYLITITSYRDCNKPLLYPNSIEVCAYNRNNLQLAKSFIFNLNSTAKVNPVGRTDCPEAVKVCLERGIYQDVITLPKSSFGYYLKWEICCRNEQVNLRNDINGNPFIGQTYQTILPPSNVKNSSPRFADVPVPFICLNDTVQLNNYAIDPDGDVLVYKLATPWYGASLTNNYPGCDLTYQPPKAILPQDYVTGYNGNIPFGASGVAIVNPSSGVATFKATKTGNYAVAIDLEEYRDGVLLSVTRLDMQILVIECSPNNKPTISAAGKDTFRIQAGENLCFDVVANDKDNAQNITLNGFGNLLTGSNGFKGNRATFNAAFGKSGVKSQFCWQTSCDQASDTPYIFTARAIDDGCPSKFTIKDYYIFVTPFTAKVKLNGGLNVCQGSKGVRYAFNTTVNNPSELLGITYDVNVVNGSLVSQNATELIINWNSSGAGGEINMTPISKFGCKGTTTNYPVTFIPAPVPPIVQSVDTLCENSSKIYTAPVLANHTYYWEVENGSVLGSNTNNSVNITWGAPGKARAKVVQYNSAGCPSDTSTIEVWISKPGIPNIVGKKVVCPNASGIEYKLVNSLPGSSYTWNVMGGTINGSQNSNSIFVKWGNQGNGSVSVFEIDRFGCRGDDGTLPVLKDYDLVLDSISGDTSLCENTLQVKYFVPYTPGTVYNWNVLGGTISSGNLSNEITVDWGAAGTGSLSMFETSYDSVNNRACVSNVINKTVFIRPYPSANLIIGNDEVCQGSGKGAYQLKGMVNSTYVWKINGSATNIIGQGSNSIEIEYLDSGTFNIEVVETSEFGCEGQPVLFKLIVHPKPNTSAIVGPNEICYPNLQNHNYSVAGLPKSTFNWLVNDGVITNPGNSNNINVNWNGQQNNTVKVIEISDFGCPGDTVKLDVFYDNPSIYLNYISVNPPPQLDNGMEVFWELRNAPRYNNQMFIERRVANSGSAFNTVGTVNGTVVYFNHSITNNDSNAWEYRMKGKDLCGNDLYSSIHTSVLLKGFKPGSYSVALNFTPYIGWGNANIRYDVYRKNGTSTYELKESNLTNFNVEYNDGLESYTQCYRIAANKLGTDTVSWSNEVCFNFDPVLFIPDAFSPNVDDLNDQFFVKGGSLKTFEFMIYNRWGEKLFVANDINFRWDGKYNGQDQPQDVYMYICYYTGFDGRKYSTKGTITLLR
jgi:gliding motility-associated-like protein